MRSKSLMFVSALFLLLLSSGVASAQVRIGVSLGGGYYPRPYYGRGYYAPRPVVVAPPVYYAPPVPVVYPAPYYARPYYGPRYAPRPYYGPRRGYYGRRY